jgi:hypothetical protein
MVARIIYELTDSWQGGEHEEGYFQKLDSGCQEKFIC